MARKNKRVSPNIYDTEAVITQSNNPPDYIRTHEDNMETQKHSTEGLFQGPLSPITEENSIELKVIDSADGINRRKSSVSNRIEELFMGQQRNNNFDDIIVEDFDA